MFLEISLKPKIFCNWPNCGCFSPLNRSLKSPLSKDLNQMNQLVRTGDQNQWPPRTNGGSLPLPSKFQHLFGNLSWSFNLRIISIEFNYELSKLPCYFHTSMILSHLFQVHYRLEFRIRVQCVVSHPTVKNFPAIAYRLRTLA